MTNRRAITASESAATRRAGKQEKEMFTNEHPTVPSYIIVSLSWRPCQELYAVHPRENRMCPEKNKPYYQSKLSASLAPWTPLWLSVTQPVSKGFPLSDKQEPNGKVLADPSARLNHVG